MLYIDTPAGPLLIKPEHRIMDVIQVMGDPPPSLAYLHALAASGQGDSYIEVSGGAGVKVVINIQWGDQSREPALKGVESVTLEYW